MSQNLDIEKITGLRLCDSSGERTIHVLRNGDFCIGRAPDNHLAVDERTVSAHHAKIYTYLTASYIEDLDSTNGTFLNGKRIKQHVLKAGDVIRMGAYQLTLQEPESPSLAESQANRAVV
ncbi:MAG: FHA domain-containing protein [Gammaproteobacteria bacterium]|jgi:pSer/pThr/pTyr-binding forkhead associated (FHA) protein